VLSNTYVGDIWELNPLRAENNLQHVGAVDWQDYISLKNQELVKRQSRYLRKIIEETSGYDNVYYEICNEPGGGFAGHASPADVDAWQSEMARVMREEMKRLNKPHLLSGQQAFTYGGNNSFPMDATFESNNFDIANDHPLPNTQFDGKVFQMGNFMSKELTLEGVRDFCRATYARPKPVSLDEDNTASIYRDLTGDVYKRQALDRTHLDLRVYQAGGANDLLHDHPGRTGELIGSGSGRDVDGLLDAILKLLELQRAVVHGRGQAEEMCIRDSYNISAVLVTNDSGPAHFSAITPIRSIVLFGPETPRLYGSCLLYTSRCV